MTSVTASIVEITLALFGYLLDYLVGLNGIIAHINEHTSTFVYFVAAINVNHRMQAHQ